MKVKTFRAHSMRAALAAVKQTFGAGAVIIYTRNVRAPGLRGLLGRHLVEVAAASDVPRGAAVEAKSAKAPERVQAVAQQRLRDAYLRQEPPRAAARNDQLKALREEIGGIRSALDEMLRGGCPPSIAGLPEALCEGYLALVRRGVAEKLAADVVRTLAGEMTEAELCFADKVRERITGRLAEHVNVSGAVRLTAGERKVVALIGPTGVGKTTTIAKLAANFKIRGHKRVALITIDTYRIAAVQQLQTIADIIKVPLYTVETVGDLQQTLDELRNVDLVLIDTAGRSQRDELKMNDLRTFIKTAGADEVHLVVSATGSTGNITEVIKRFKTIGPNRLLMSKVDEAETFGGVVSAASSCGLPVSYMTMGQEIPNDIEVADGSRVAAMVWER